MKKIGFDFGTTNSMISYFDSKNKRIEPFSATDKNEYYLPTVIAYKKDGSVSIGSAAKGKINDSDYETYERFKLFLGADFDKPFEGRSRTPSDITKDYIGSLLELYKARQNIDKIDTVVMTVPAIWKREQKNVAAVDNIMSIYQSLGVQAKLESEPEAACVYFCWAYEQANKKKYEGHVLVIDFGGGTLDIALCKQTKDGVSTLETSGYGEHNIYNGCAGVAFDEEVVTRIISRFDNGFTKNIKDKKYTRALVEFEKNKIDNIADVVAALILYYDDPDLAVEYVFKLDYGDEELKVYPKDLAESFEKINAEYLRKALEEMKGYFAFHKVDFNDQKNDKFKVLLVGGFSNFYSVKKEVENFFNSKIGSDDLRFQTCYPESDRAYAISKGAALVADGIIPLDQRSRYAYGIEALTLNGDIVDREIMPKGIKLSDAMVPKFYSTWFSSRSNTARITIYQDDAKRKIRLPLDKRNEELFPNYSIDNKWQIGFSLDSSEIPTMHFKDLNGVEKKHSINKIIESMPAIEEEDNFTQSKKKNNK